MAVYGKYEPDEVSTVFTFRPQVGLYEALVTYADGTYAYGFGFTGLSARKYAIGAPRHSQDETHD